MRKLVKKDSCSSLGKENKNISGTCLAIPDLNKLVSSIVQVSNDKVKTMKSKDKLKLLQNKVKKIKGNNIGCDVKKEECLIQQLSPELYKKYYKPVMPREWYDHPYEWLSNVEIEEVLRQYEENPKNNFKFLAVSPINFSDQINNYFAITKSNTCVSNALCNLNKDKLREFLSKKKYKLGIVFNTDTYGNSGKHWICVFANVNPRSKNYGIYYFDSNASFESKYIDEITKKIQAYTYTLTHKPISIHKNTIRVQKTTNSECGMFCLYMIINMIKNKSFHSLINNKLTDELVFKHREIYFNKI